MSVSKYWLHLILALSILLFFAVFASHARATTGMREIAQWLLIEDFLIELRAVDRDRRKLTLRDWAAKVQKVRSKRPEYRDLVDKLLDEVPSE